LKGEQGGRDAQPGFIIGKDAVILGWKDCSKCSSPAVNKNGSEKVNAGVYSSTIWSHRQAQA
jgi:hypothetical protein